MQVGWGAAQLDLAVEWCMNGEELEVTLEYNADWYSEGMAQDISADYLVRCLEASRVGTAVSSSHGMGT